MASFTLEYLIDYKKGEPKFALNYIVCNTIVLHMSLHMFQNLQLKELYFRMCK